MSNLTDLIDELSIAPGENCPECGTAFSSTCMRCAQAQKMRLVAERLVEHDAEVRFRAVKNVSRKIHNGAGDPEQEFYDRSLAPWLEKQAVEEPLSTPGISLEFVRKMMFA